VPAGAGGGLTVDVVAALNSTASVSGFDISLRYDTTVLNAVSIDQSGLVWGGAGTLPPGFVLTLVKSIDRTNGVVRVAEVLVGVPQQIGSVELFRVRFDILATSTSTPLTLFNDVLVNPSVVPTVDKNVRVDTTSFFNRLNSGALNFVTNWTLTPNPEVVGSPLTFTAQAFCPGCTLPLTYKWDLSSSDSPVYVPKVDKTGNTVSVTAPPPVVNRVTLNVTDGAQHFALATRSLPLAASVTGTSSLAQDTAGGSWTGKWLGGVVTSTSGYGGSWSFCPGSAFVKSVCSVPTLAFVQSPGSITQTASAGPVTYKFAGVYTVLLKVSDTAESQTGSTAKQVVVTTLTNVTGSTPAYTVSVAANASLSLVNRATNFTATIAYASTYPSAFQSSYFNYTFDFGDGTPGLTVTSSQTTSVVHSYTSPGNFVVRVVAMELSAKATARIMEAGFLNENVVTILCNVASSCGFSQSSASPTAGQSVTFSATASGGSSPYTFSWTFGDGTTGTGSSVNHSYQSSGPFTVTLTITDSSGQTAQVKKTVTVLAGNARSSFLDTLASPFVLAGIAAAIVAAVAAVLLVRRRRRVPSTAGASVPNA
jgi:PKD repeat protein